MKHKIIISSIISSTLILAASVSAYSQFMAPLAPVPDAFHKHCFRINLSEGSTYSTYKTSEIYTHEPINTTYIKGCRDPLALEYGLSDHFGIGISMGTDVFQINPSTFYAYQAQTNPVKTTTSELTIDGSYHFCVCTLSDMSLVASFGSASVSMKGGSGDQTYQYMANGGIVRLGLHERFFFCKYVGFVGMVSAYSETVSPQGVKGNSIGNNYSTSISGITVEGGFCFRFKR